MLHVHHYKQKTVLQRSLSKPFFSSEFHQQKSLKCGHVGVSSVVRYMFCPDAMSTRGLLRTRSSSAAHNHKTPFENETDKNSEQQRREYKHA